MKHSLFTFGLLFAGLQAGQAAILLSENFDGGSVNSTYAYTSTSGTAPSTQNAGGTHGNVARLTNNDAGNNNSIAFNAVNIPSTPVLRLTFDFYMSSDPAGGQSADGLGIGFFPTAIVGATGGINPATLNGGATWESGNFPAATGALSVGMRIYNSNDIHLNWNGMQMATGNAGFILNSDQWHRGVLTLRDEGVNSRADLTFTGNIDGTPVAGPTFSNVLLNGVDLDAIGSNYRLIAGGRTGGAFVRGELDNIRLEAVPEPSLTVLSGLAAAAFGLRRRRSAAV